MAASQLTGAHDRADHPVDSDPNPDEALRRVQSAPSPAVQRAVRSPRREVRNTVNAFLGR